MLDDGQMDVVLVEGVRKRMLPRALVQLMRGKILGQSYTRHALTQRLRVRFAQPATVRLMESSTMICRLTCASCLRIEGVSPMIHAATEFSTPAPLGDCHIHMALDSVDFRRALGMHRDGVQDGWIRARLADYAADGVRFLRDGGDKLGVADRARALAAEYSIDYRSPGFPSAARDATAASSGGRLTASANTAPWSARQSPAGRTLSRS